jgi:hypothetical protein
MKPSRTSVVAICGKMRVHYFVWFDTQIGIVVTQYSEMSTSDLSTDGVGITKRVGVFMQPFDPVTTLDIRVRPEEQGATEL